MILKGLIKWRSLDSQFLLSLFSCVSYGEDAYLLFHVATTRYWRDENSCERRECLDTRVCYREAREKERKRRRDRSGNA